MNSKNTEKIDSIYEPQEDSYMLLEFVKEYAKGKVLDVGTGSGIQGIGALENSDILEVDFCDINPKCISYLRSVVKDKRANYTISNLFSRINRNKIFDTIIFNPPYLPEDDFDKTLHNVGGKKGYETILEFLKQAKPYLKEDGIILLLFSSLSNKKIIDRNIEKDYVYEELSVKSFFMEQLYVYRIEKKRIMKGHRGFVEINNYKRKDRDNVIKNSICAIKYSRTEFYDSNKEAKFLKLLNKNGIGPKFLKLDKKNNRLVMEYIYGDRIIDFMQKNNKNNILQIIEQILHQLLLLDKLGINKQELTNPYKHIIIKRIQKENIPIMIDFERCQYTDRPKNITQFIQFLCSGRIKHTFEEKSITVDASQLLNIAKKYSQEKRKDKDIVSQIMICLR